MNIERSDNSDEYIIDYTKNIPKPTYSPFLYQTEKGWVIDATRQLVESENERSNLISGIAIGLSLAALALNSTRIYIENRDDNVPREIQLHEPLPATVNSLFATETTEVSKVITPEVEQFVPSHIKTLNGIDSPVVEGKRDDNGKDLVIPDGEVISNFTDDIPAGENTIVLSGHSWWLNEIQPMHNTFTLVPESEIILSDGSNEVPFVVKDRLVLDWDATIDLLRKDKDKNTAITFTSLRSVGPEGPKQQYPRESIIDMADNKEQVEGFYESDDYLYWVIVAEVESPFETP